MIRNATVNGVKYASISEAYGAALDGEDISATRFTEKAAVVAGIDFSTSAILHNVVRLPTRKSPNFILYKNDPPLQYRSSDGKRLFLSVNERIDYELGRNVRPDLPAPRSGLVNVVEESSDNLGRWFARYGGDGAETFSARLLNGTDELGIAWTQDVRRIAPSIAEIQGAVGRNIPRITGTASDGLEAAIKAGRFNSELYARQLSRHLGGQWKVEALRRSGVSNEVWDIIATRIGGQQ